MVTDTLVRLALLFNLLTWRPDMNQKHSLELDFYYEAPRPQSTPEVEVTLVMEEGPAGGNPLYRLEGTLPDLQAWLEQNYCEAGQEPVSFYLSRAKPV